MLLSRDVKLQAVRALADVATVTTDVALSPRHDPPTIDGGSLAATRSKP
jgi:hypothetical protein